MKLNNASNIHFNNKSASKVYLNNNTIWTKSSQLLLLDASNYTSGSTWLDESGLDNHATIYNSPTNGGDSFTLNGTDQYFDVTGSFDDFSNGITVLAFANFGNASNWERIIDFGEGQGQNNVLLARQGTTDNLAFEVYDGSSGYLLNQYLTSGIGNNDWGFYGARLDGSEYKVFNEITNITGSSSALPANVTRTNNYIGRSNWAVDSYFESEMGVVAVYNKALTDDEITTFFDTYKSTYGLTRVRHDLLLEYDSKNYSSGTTMTDSSGNSRNGTIGGSPSHDGDYFTFSNDYITTADLDSVITSAEEQHSVEVWIYPTNNGVVVQYNGQATPDIDYHFSAIEIVNGNLEIGMWNGTSISSTGNLGAVSFNQWHQLVLTFNGTSCKGYIDGVYKGAVLVVWESPMDGAYTAFHMNFGYEDFTDQGDGTHFDGKFGLMRVYGDTLSDAEVEYNWNNTKSSFGL